MKIRGQRECRDCGHRWSYYETGGVACPACESLESVGVDDRTLHTDAPVTLDLTPYRTAATENRLSEVLDDCKRDLRRYVRKRGFVDGGDLRQLDDTVVAASELRSVVDAFDRLRSPTDADHTYLLALLQGADGGNRPPPSAVSDGLAAARGLGDANAVDAYREDLLAWLDENPDEAARRVLGTLHQRRKRVTALQGDVSPTEAESLVQAARDVGTYLIGGDAASLATARERLR